MGGRRRRRQLMMWRKEEEALPVNWLTRTCSMRRYAFSKLCFQPFHFFQLNHFFPAFFFSNFFFLLLPFQLPLQGFLRPFARTSQPASLPARSRRQLRMVLQGTRGIRPSRLLVFPSLPVARALAFPRAGTRLKSMSSLSPRCPSRLLIHP